MSSLSQIKSSSRAGRFKKKLATEKELLIEAPLIEAKMAPVLDLFHKNRLSHSELTTIYLLFILIHRYPKLWLGSKRPCMNIHHKMNYSLSDLHIVWQPNIQKRLEGIHNLGELLNHFALKSTPETVSRSLLNWSNGSYGLELMFRIPSSLEVLAQQKMARRCVTVLTNIEKTNSYVLGERDPLSFTMHDLIHADHFYFHPECFEGQLDFYWFIDACMKDGDFDEHLKVSKFSSELDYLISDMNAYAVHLFKCLKAALVFHHAEGVKYFVNWAQKITSDSQERQALIALNSKTYIPEIQDAFILNLISRSRRSAT